MSREEGRPALLVRFPGMTFSGIYAIVDAGVSSDPLAILDAVLRAGIRVVQYRAKAGVDRDVLRAMLGRTRPSGAALIVNDDLEAGLEADGVHVGQEDLLGRDPRELRARLGTRIFGISAGVAAEARIAEAAGADYVGTGPFASTQSKSDAGDAIGEAALAHVVAATRLPVVAIGGIDLSNLDRVASTGVAMAAVISAIARAAEPAVAARALVERWQAFRA